MAKASVHPADLLGLGRVAIEGTARLTGLVGDAHHSLADTSPLTNLAYDGILAITGLVGGGMDAILAPLVTTLKQPGSTVELDALLAALNGAMGDYLAATNNPLAIPMRLRRKNRPATGNSCSSSTASA